jgi:hypothetical protein
MTTTIPSLWPEDIQTQEVISPLEILNEQARLLEKQTNGLLVGNVVEHVVQDRKVLGFEVTASRVPTTVRLFEIQQSPEFEYPVAIVPPDVSIPDFLKSEVYRPGPFDGVSSLTSVQGKWVKKEWVASSPSEFTEKLRRLLSMTGVKSILLSLLSRSNRKSGDSESSASAEER